MLVWQPPHLLHLLLQPCLTLWASSCCLTTSTSGFLSLLGLLHTTQTSIKGMVVLVKLIYLLLCLLQMYLQWGDGVGPHKATIIKRATTHAHIQTQTTHTPHTHTHTPHTHTHTHHIHTHTCVCLSSCAALRSSHLPDTSLTHTDFANCLLH